MREVPCLACDGARLKPISLAVTIGGKNIAQMCALPIDEAAAFLASDLDLSEREMPDRRTGPEGDQRAAAVPARRRAGLPQR